MEVYTVDNGAIQIKAAPEFFPSIFSMNHNGEEWLDHSFPTAKAKSWWNPWGGGSAHYMTGINNNSYVKEIIKAEFVTQRDHLQNEWRGIKLETKIEDHKVYKGLRWNQYYLMLPGIPVVCSVVEILQDTDKFLPQSIWEYSGFLKITDGERKGWAREVSRDTVLLSKGESVCIRPVIG